MPKYPPRYARFFFFFLAEALFLAFFQNLANVDKLWNYTFAENIASGLLPYRDFNILQTPFSAALNGFFLTLFGHHMLVIEIAGAFLFALICWQLYTISVRFAMPTAPALIFSQCFLLLFEWNVFLEYSCLIVLFSLTLARTDLASRDGMNRFLDMPALQILPGLLGGLAMMSKQTYGFFVAAASCISLMYLCHVKRPVYAVDPGTDTAESGSDVCPQQAPPFFRPGTIRLLACRLIGILIPNFIFLFYLLYTGTFADFWDMAIAGVSTFSSRFPYLTLAKENIGNTILCIAVPVMILSSILFGLFKRKTRSGQAALILLIYGLFGLINLYPMANFYHFSTCLIAFLPLLALLIGRRFWRFRLPRQICQLINAAVLVVCVLYIPIKIVREHHLNLDIPQFEGVFITDEREADIRLITDYVREKEKDGYTVYILDNRASQYFLPLDRYNKYFDLFLLGNMGTTPPEDLLAAAVKENTIFLIPGKDLTEWQYPFDAVNALKKELVKGEEIGGFIAYYPEF